jgi:tetrahydromethanopterin S-methyltransferase subunit A
MSLLNDLSHFVRRNLTPKSVQWPFVRGDYAVVDATAPIVVAGVLADTVRKDLAAASPGGLCMIALLHTAADVADLVHALAANLAIQYVICAGGPNAKKRPLGAALLLLGRGEEAPAGPVGALLNAIVARIEPAELKAVRRRVQFVDLLGSGDLAKISARIEESAAAAGRSNTGFVTQPTEDGVERLIVPRDFRHEGRRDKAGDFSIRIEEHSIIVEHRNGKDRLLRVIEGKTARDVCLVLIRNGWVSRLDHAAYLGRELARAELALRSGQPFTPDTHEGAQTPRSSAAER